MNIVHQLIESTKIKFILSGSSARKIKKGGANLLAGRAFVFYLYPFTAFELDKKFELNKALKWGCLPKLLNLKNDRDKKDNNKKYQ